jgi:hypothetical protein
MLQEGASQRARVKKGTALAEAALVVGWLASKERKSPV